MGIEEYCRQCGINPKQFPRIAGTYSGGLLVCGDARCIWDDLERFGAKVTVNAGRVAKAGWDIMTINKVVETLPGNIEHCYSNEPQTLLRFMAARRAEYVREFSPPKHSHSLTEGCEFTWPFGGHATSGLGATLVGIALGYSQIVLCGIPLDDTPHNGEPPWRKCYFETSEAAGSVNTGWNAHWQKAGKFAFNGKVRSMSGRTRQWFGLPEMSAAVA